VLNFAVQREMLVVGALFGTIWIDSRSPAAKVTVLLLSAHWVPVAVLMAQVMAVLAPFFLTVNVQEFGEVPGPAESRMSRLESVPLV
jgi:hypothetical protein